MITNAPKKPVKKKFDGDILFYYFLCALLITVLVLEFIFCYNFKYHEQTRPSRSPNTVNDAKY